MILQPVKCNIMQLTRAYSLEGTVLENVDNIKYLGVTISKDLKWNTHVSNVCTKANRILGFLRRNISSCPPKMLRRRHKRGWCDQSEYASPVWDPHGIVVQEELEKIQNFAARFVTGNYNFETGSMTSILEQLGWESPHKKRKGSKLILLFKGLKGRAIYLVMTFNLPLPPPPPPPHTHTHTHTHQIDAVGISIHRHFKCHMPKLIFISTVSFQTPLGFGMHSMQLYSPLLKVLRTLSLDSHHL